MSHDSTIKFVISKLLDDAGFVVGARVVVSDRIKTLRAYGPYHIGRHGVVVKHHGFSDLVYVRLAAVGRQSERELLFRPKELDLVGGAS